MRPQALATALRAAGFEMKSVAASGDCFYDCIDMQLSGQDRPEPLADAGAMRDTVASSITDEMYELMKVFAQAGVVHSSTSIPPIPDDLHTLALCQSEN